MSGLFKCFFFLLCSLYLTGCATILRGYEDRVDLVNAPDDIQVYTRDSIQVPVTVRTERRYSEEQKKYYDKEIKTISLRTNKEHLLFLKSGDKEKRIEIYPRLGGAWLVLDIITGGFPAIIDMYTGSWNFFRDIEAGF